METDLSLGSAPAVADAASATIMRRAGELLRVIAKHLLDGSDSGRQTEALKGAVHILPAGHERERLTGALGGMTTGKFVMGTLERLRIRRLAV
jgi:hypothetical protein